MTTVFNTSEVKTGRVDRIINFLNSSSDFFIALGKPTPWDNTFGLNISDLNPPFPNEYTDSIIEPIIYKRIQIGVGANSIVSAASNKLQCSDFVNNQDVLGGTILINQSPATQNFTFYALEDLINTEGFYKYYPEFIYIQGEINDTEYNTNDWRISALYTKLFLKENVPNNLNIYLPSQVSGGLLHYITYNSPVLRQSGKTHNFEYIINI